MSNKRFNSSSDFAVVVIALFLIFSCSLPLFDTYIFYIASGFIRNPHRGWASISALALSIVLTFASALLIHYYNKLS